MPVSQPPVSAGRCWNKERTPLRVYSQQECLLLKRMKWQSEVAIQRRSARVVNGTRNRADDPVSAPHPHRTPASGTEEKNNRSLSLTWGWTPAGTGIPQPNCPLSRWLGFRACGTAGSRFQNWSRWWTLPSPHCCLREASVQIIICIQQPSSAWMALDLIAIYPGGKSKAESEMRNIHPLPEKKKLSSSLRTFSLSLKRKKEVSSGGFVWSTDRPCLQKCFFFFISSLLEKKINTA